MTTLLFIFIAALIGAFLGYYFQAAIHKAEIDGRDVMIDEAKQARAWAESEYATIKAKLAVFEEHLGVPAKPALPKPPAIPDPKISP